VETALLRPAEPVELASLQEFLDGQRIYYATNTAEAGKLLHVGLRPPVSNVPSAEQAAWTSLARVVLNLHETITRY
jgi:hypothetical protein